MAKYTKNFTKPYSGGYKDKPDKTTPVTADILNMQDNAFEAIEEYLANIETGLPDDITINDSLIVGSGQGDGATGTHSMINGTDCSATGNDSHAEGTHTTASGQASHSEGINTIASGVMSHAEGYETKASGTYQHVQGKYNVEDTENKYAHIVGGGTSDTERKNIYALDWNGNAEFAGDVRTGNGASLDDLNEQSGSMAENISTMQTELTSQGKAIGELTDKKITKFYASSQGDSTLSDSDDGKMQDMMLYGKSEQKQYSGKNLLNAALQTQTVNGVACTANGDGTFTLSGMATANAYFEIFTFTFSKGVNYKLIGCPKGGDMDTKYGLYVDQIWAKDNGQGVTFSVDETLEEKIIIIVVSGNSINNLVFKPMLVDADKYPSVTYDDFEPYVGGIPSPNPDYPQEIKSVVEPVVKVTGKNLIDVTEGTEVVANKAFVINVEANKQYTITISQTMKSIGTSNGAAQHFYKFLNSNDEPVRSGNVCYLRFTSDGETKSVSETISSPDTAVKLYLDIGAYFGSNSPRLITNYVQVELGSKATAYEPYTSQSVPLTGITLNAIPVSSGGNVTIEGQQYISDYVDVERGKVVRMVGKKILNGSETWVTNGKDGGRVLYTPLDTAKQCIYFNSNTRSLNPVLSNMLLQSKENYAGVGLYKTSLYNSPNIKDYPGKNWLYINIGKLKNEAIQFLQNNNITVYYPLATPTEESLSDELAEKLKALQTYYPQTNLFITSNQLDGYAIFNYPISLANGWNYVKQQIGDTRDYIYDMDLQMAQAYVNSEYAVALTELEV